MRVWSSKTNGKEVELGFEWQKYRQVGMFEEEHELVVLNVITIIGYLQ